METADLVLDAVDRGAAPAGRARACVARADAAVSGDRRRRAARVARPRGRRRAARRDLRLRRYRRSRWHRSTAVDRSTQRLPRHVAIIMDGNRRWARERRMPAIEGHRRGIVALREVTRAASDWGIPMLTVYGFSTENWKRDSTEISLLLDLCVYFAQSELAELRRNNVRVQRDRPLRAAPAPSRDALDGLMRTTSDCTGLHAEPGGELQCAQRGPRCGPRARARRARRPAGARTRSTKRASPSYLYTAEHAGSGHADPSRRRIAAVQFLALSGRVHGTA